MSLEKSHTIRCPSCDLLVDVRVNSQYLPFCSHRCRLIDLGRWLNEENTLPCEPMEDVEPTADESPIAPRKLPPGWNDP